MSKKPQIHNTEILCQSRLFKIEQVSLSFNNNEQRDYERIIAPGHGAVLIVPVIDDANILLIKEYCVGTHNYQLLFPKGKIDDAESIEQTAQRELREETGYAARKLTHLRSMSIAPGYLEFITHIVIAEDLYAHPLEGDEPEVIEVHKFNIHQFDDLLQHRDFTEARSIACLYMVRDYLAGKTADAPA